MDLRELLGGSSAGEADGGGDLDTGSRVEDPEGMMDELEEAAARAISKEREPFHFDVFRNEEEEVTSWALMAQAIVDGEDSQVPVVVGGEQNMWFEYNSRHPAERDHSVFEYAQKEEVVPSNLFYKWVSESVEAISNFQQELNKIEDRDAFDRLDPELPPIYSELNQYEKETLHFLGEILIDHREYTEEQIDLIGEALRRYPVEDEVLDSIVEDSETESEDSEQ